VALVAIAAGYLTYYHHSHPSVPLGQLFTVDYWHRLSIGKENFDPNTGMLYHGNPKYREIALTIDDGPHALYGQVILDILTKYQVPATFFVVGVRVKQEPDQVREMVALGNEVGNHTYDHQRLNKLANRFVKSELKLNEEAVFRAVGVHMSVMRPPGERFTADTLAIAKKMGYCTINWTNAAKDYETQSPDYIVRHVVDSTAPGSSVLLHQDNPDTAKALERVIPALKKQGYRFVTVSTMLAHLGIEPYANEEAKALAQKPGYTPILANGSWTYAEDLSSAQSGRAMGAVAFEHSRKNSN